MSNTEQGGDDPHHGTISPAEREEFRTRAKELDQRLDRVEASRASRKRSPSPWATSGLGKAFRFATELVVGVGVGGFIGWALDGYLGTRPWLMLLFLFLGFGAAMMNIIRAAKQMQAEAEPLQRSAPSVPDDEDESDT